MTELSDRDTYLGSWIDGQPRCCDCCGYNLMDEVGKIRPLGLRTCALPRCNEIADRLFRAESYIRGAMND
jgi:hypothetical protein